MAFSRTTSSYEQTHKVLCCQSQGGPSSQCPLALSGHKKQSTARAWHGGTTVGRPLTSLANGREHHIPAEPGSLTKTAQSFAPEQQISLADQLPQGRKGCI